MNRLILVALAAISFVAQAQKSPIKYGDIPMEDMKMTIYAKDSSAVGVVLADYGVAYVAEAGGVFQMNFDRHTRIKILKKEGLDLANSYVSLYLDGEEKVSSLKASSYNLDGGKIVETKLSKDGMFKEKFNKYYDRQKFTVPNVKEGSIIEYSYRKTSASLTNFPNWQFQRGIPTRISEYWAMIPDAFVFQKYMQGYVPVSNYEEKVMTYFGEPVKGYHYVSLNVPAFKEEPFMTTEDDFVSKMNFAISYYNGRLYQQEIMGTWEKLRSDLLESDAFGGIITGSGFLKDKVEQVVAGKTDPLEKIAAISSYIKQNVEYDNDDDFLAYPPKKVLEQKKGSSGDINILFAAMLNKAGLETDMILLSTRDHGFIRQQYPMRRQFNYVICAVRLADKTLFVDATNKYLPYDVLPSKCLNGQGFTVSKKNFGWIDITNKAKEKTVVNADMALDASGELKGKVEYTRDGYDAQRMRESYMKDGEAKYVENFSKGRQWQIAKSEFQDVKEFGKQPKEIHEVSISEHSSTAGEVIYVSPFVTSQLSENPFKSDTRTYPVDYGNLTEKIYIVKIALPEGYAVDELPKSKIMALPGNAGRYLYNASQVGNSINITSSFMINKSLFTYEEYPDLKEFYNQVVAKQAEQIVLKKK
jgi:Transglutaminase-like superfamily/Domain of Unknown Function with PDB structure (DUF3857)